MTARRNKYFRKEDVNVRFPKPTSIIDARRKPLSNPVPPPTKASKFTHIRTVMNLGVIDVTQPKKIKLKFVPPFELVVGYNGSDLKNAGGRKLCLGYWDARVLDWIPLTQPKNNSRVGPLDPKKNRGLIIVDIDEWGDPPIAIGT